MKNYKITLGMNYNDIFLNVIIINDNIDIDIAEKIANSTKVTICSDKLHIASDNMDSFDITDDDRELYQFQICTKEFKIDNTKTWNTEESDYKDVDWNISQAYQMIKEEYPNEKEYKFDSLFYKVEEV